MNKELIKTDSFWYKMRSFFYRKFDKDKTSKTAKIDKKFLTEYEKNKLGKKLITDDFLCFELKDDEADQMLLYFDNQLRQMDNEINMVKSHINYMKENRSDY